MRFGQYRVPVARPPPGLERSSLGIRPESFEDAAFAPGLPTIEVLVEVLEDLGSDAHVFFPVDAPPITAEVLETASEEGLLRRRPGALHRPGRRAHGCARRRASSTLAVDPARFQFFDPDSGARLETAPAHRRWPRIVTKQRETRERVLELIEALERRRRDPVRAAARHRPRRLAADRARGARRARARGLSHPPPRRGHVRRRAEGREGHDITSFSDDMRTRGLTPGSRTLELRDDPGRRAARPHPARLAVRARASRQAPAPRRRRADGDRAPARPAALVPGLTARDLEESSFYDLLASRYDIEIVGGTQTVEPTVTNEEESATLGVPLHSPALLFERVTRSSDGESSSSRARSTAATATGSCRSSASAGGPYSALVASDVDQF